MRSSGGDWSFVRNVNGKETTVNQPLAFPLSSGKTWTIALRPGGALKHAMHLQIVDFDDGNQVTLLKFADRLAPSI